MLEQQDGAILLGADHEGNGIYLPLKMCNRHGLIAGATGTGKTVSVQVMAEAFSRAGVPVFVSDVKGDLSGVAAEGADKDFLHKRAETIQLGEYGPEACPVRLWDFFGQGGLPIRVTATEIGPLLLARMLDLNDTQEGVLSIAFRVADDDGLPILDLDDLRSILAHVSERRAELSAMYGNVSPSSVAAIQRRLLQLEDQGGNVFFGEPALDIHDLLDTDRDGRGIISVLKADKLMLTPRLYGTFLLYLLSELFEELPEIGDPEKPKLVFVFDEAHLLFDGASSALLEKVEQVCRLIRSKGVGVFFATQDPGDIPDGVAGQLGTKVQHALRAFTPAQAKRVKAAADSFRPNPAFATKDVITELGVGEALVSTLQKKGIPTPAAKTLIRPPSSRLGPLAAAERKELIRQDARSKTYAKPVNRYSAYEMLAERAERLAKEAEKAESKTAKVKRERSTKRRRSNRMSMSERAMSQATRTATRTIVGALMRGIMGGLKRR
ncbi:MAG: helicase HerA-like domain-containing protein [Pseudomonadota bacterium]